MIVFIIRTTTGALERMRSLFQRSEKTCCRRRGAVDQPRQIRLDGAPLHEPEPDRDAEPVARHDVGDGEAVARDEAVLREHLRDDLELRADALLVELEVLRAENPPFADGALDEAAFERLP